MGKQLVVLAGLLISFVLHAQCLKEREEKAHEVVKELSTKAKSIDSGLVIKVVECNIQILGTIEASQNKKTLFNTKRKEIENECQRLFNSGLVRVKKLESIPTSKDFNGTCISFVHMKVPTGNTP